MKVNTARSIGALDVHDQGDGPVVDELHLHVGAELAALRAERLPHPPVQRFGRLRRRGLDEARAVSLARVGVEREVRNAQDLALDVAHRAVHLAVVVLEYPQRDQLLGHPVRAGLVVVPAHAEQDQKAARDHREGLAVHQHRGMLDALDDRAHQPATRIVCRVVFETPARSLSRATSDAVTSFLRATSARPRRVSVIFATQRRPGTRWKVRVPSVRLPSLSAKRPRHPSAVAGEQRTGIRTDPLLMWSAVEEAVSTRYLMYSQSVRTSGLSETTPSVPSPQATWSVSPSSVWMMSSPLPPSKASAPAPPRMRSFPSPPASALAPPLPISTS